jgi:hypothetical protein
LGGRVQTVKKNTGTLVLASKEIGLEVNVVKTKYMVMCRDQNAGQVHNIKIDKNSFEKVEESNIWEQLYQIKILFWRKLSAA